MRIREVLAALVLAVSLPADAQTLSTLKTNSRVRLVTAEGRIVDGVFWHTSADSVSVKRAAGIGMRTETLPRTALFSVETWIPDRPTSFAVGTIMSGALALAALEIKPPKQGFPRESYVVGCVAVGGLLQLALPMVGHWVRIPAR